MLKEDQNPICGISLFENLAEHDCLKISQMCNWKQYERSHQMLHEDECTTDIFFIAEGAVSAKSFSPDGKEVTYLELSSGDIFGEFSAIDREHRSATVTTTEPSLIGRLNATQFELLLIKHPQLSIRFANHLVAKIRNLSTRVYEFSTLSVRCRLHAELLRMSTKSSDTNTADIDPAPTHYELATHISTHREAVSREISRLVHNGILQTNGRTYVIRDLNRLKELVELARI